MNILAYPRLYRLDVVLISFFSYVVGAQIAGGLDSVDFLVALGVALGPMNFIYSFNSWSDWKIDAINKPHRPIPSGQIPPRAALVYTLGLLALSVALPLLVTRGTLGLALFWALPVLGLAYSLKPVRLKRFPVPAVVATSLLLVIPITAGYVNNGGGAGNKNFFLALFFFCLATIPLKDIEDVEGDVAGECGNWFDKLGGATLLALCAAGHLANITFICLAPMGPGLRPFLLAFGASALLLMALFALLRLPLFKLYRSIIRAVIVLGVVIFLLLKYQVRLPWS